MVLRYKDPTRHRPFKVPFVYVVGTLGALACLYTIKGLPSRAWYTFGIWMAIGLVLYFSYGYRHSVLRTGKQVEAEEWH
jgi:APA family basic amino acid/polyamine antiporter